MTAGRADASVVRRHLLALDEALQTLRKHQGRPVETLEGDREELWIVVHGLQLCAQNALDIATHLAAVAGRDVPDYGSAIDRLAEIGVLEPAFAARFRGIAGFRNVVIHGYLQMDVRTVHRLLNERLEDFVEFARCVNARLA